MPIKLENEINVFGRRDVAHVGDIEKALQYSLTKEIPLNTVIDSQMMYAIHMWINVAIR